MRNLRKAVCLYVLIVSLMCVSCKKEMGEEAFLKLFPHQEDGLVENLPISSDDLREPSSMAVYKNHLIFLDYGLKDTLFSVFDIHSGKHIANFGLVGNGPNEFIDVTSLYSVNDELVAYERTAQRLVRIKPQDAHYRTISYNRVPVIRDSIFRAPFNAIPRDGMTYFASGIMRNKRIAILDKDGKSVDAFGRYPYESENSGLKYLSISFLYQSIMSYCPAKKRLAISSAEGIQIQFYDMSRIKSPKEIRSYEYLRPDFKVDKDGSVIFSKENTTGIIEIACSSNYFFCLYSNSKFSQSTSGYEAYTATRLLVFDLDGKPVRIINFKQGYTSLVVNQDKNELYLLGQKEQNADYVVSRLKIDGL